MHAGVAQRQRRGAISESASRQISRSERIAKPHDQHPDHQRRINRRTPIDE
jgi:hypothetical protein